MDKKFIKVNKAYRWDQGTINIEDIYINPKHIISIECDTKECKLFMPRQNYGRYTFIIPKEQFIKPPNNMTNIDEL
jgi:hypothetical protein